MAKSNSSTVQQLLQFAIKERRELFLEPEAKEICRNYGIPTPDFAMAKSAVEAAKSAKKVGYPVVLKVVSPDILHKTEARGVLLNLRTRDQVVKGYDAIMRNAKAYSEKARVRGVLVQHMAAKGVEVIVGALRDKQFGPTVMFGLGGVFVEVLKDASFRVAPIDELDAREMVHEIKAYPILAGFRGQPSVDERAIIQILLALSHMILENPSIDQVDLNPVMVYGNGASVVDARMILSERSASS